ncbi:hypothetical protein ALC62_10047 [Cyphomyrmex costatus]|uniref:Uncharacterized protein n=1 Tax=Cyphomyrmex costatus TaxID=456900 RepID=A0A151IEI9_9HYME|nr:hypothetical protein ALC62_10047 [Cyphomyrmex costatus]
MTCTTTAPPCLCSSSNKSCGKSSIAGGVQFIPKNSLPAARSGAKRERNRLTVESPITSATSPQLTLSSLRAFGVALKSS